MRKKNKNFDSETKFLAMIIIGAVFVFGAALGAPPNTPFKISNAFASGIGQLKVLSAYAASLAESLNPQTKKPVIQTVEIKKISGNTAEIYWATDILAHGSLDVYLESKLIARFKPPGDAAEKSHVITLRNLSPKTQYNIIVYAWPKNKKDSSLMAKSARKSFTTGKAQDDEKPKITNVKDYFKTGKTISMSWETNEPTTGKIYYGEKREKLNSTKSSGKLSTIHDITISNLETGKTYYYKIQASDNFKNKFETAITTFFTASNDGKDTAELTITNIKPADIADPNITDKSVLIEWETNIASSGAVRYGAGKTRGKKVETSVPRKTRHSTLIQNLEPETEYTFVIEARDVRNKTAVSPISSFKTKPALKTSGPQNSEPQKQAGGPKNNGPINPGATMLIKRKNKPQVYLVENGQKRYIRDEKAFYAHGFKFYDVVAITDEFFRSLPTGKTITE